MIKSWNFHYNRKWG